MTSVETTEELNQQRVIASQLHVQNNLNGDLSLAAVGRVVGTSAYHFHRTFKERVGETLKEYVDRLRVEKSLYDL